MEFPYKVLCLSSILLGGFPTASVGEGYMRIEAVNPVPDALPHFLSR